MVPEISADLIALYELLRKTTNGSPVARVERGMCQGLQTDAVDYGAAARPHVAHPCQMQQL